MSKALRNKSATFLLAQMSRPTSSIGGKNSLVLKTSVPDEVGEMLDRKARELGYRDGAEFRREVFILVAFGEQALLNLHSQRIRGLGLNLGGFSTAAGR